MEDNEAQRIARFLLDVHESICDGDEAVTMQQHLPGSYRVIKLLMDRTSETESQDLKVFLASLEYEARKYKQVLEGRSGARN